MATAPGKKVEDCCEEDDGSIVVDEENRKLYLFGVLNEIKAANFLMYFQRLDVTDGDIKVILNSPGGSTHAGYTIYDVIMLSRNKVIVEVYGKCYSMAVAVLQAGDERLMSPYSELMVHGVYTDELGELTMKDAGTLRKELRAENDKYQELVAKRAGMPVAKLRKLCSKDTFMAAEKAVEQGFADRILVRTKE